MALDEKEVIENEELNTEKLEVENEVHNDNVQQEEANETQLSTDIEKEIDENQLPDEQNELVEDTQISSDQTSDIDENQSSIEHSEIVNETPSSNEQQDEKSDNASASNTNSVVNNNSSSEDTYKQIDNQNSIGKFVFKICENVVFTLIAILVIAFTIFTIVNTDNSAISPGVSILGIDVSGLEKEAATDKMLAYVGNCLEKNDIVLKHNDYETNISTDQIQTNINILSAIDAAFEISSGSNIFTNSFKKLSLLVNPINIKPDFSINTEQLNTTLSDISTQLPDAVKQSDYYIDGNNLIVTTGKSGVVIDNEAMINIITSKISDLSYKDSAIEIITINKDPDELNIDNIYNEIHKEAVNARYDAATHIVYPEENGLDFNITLDEAKAMLNDSKEEYTIPLKTLYPSVTTNMIGMEAFPNLLSSFNTRYPASNRDRTTNLRLAASKVNGTVVLPGQTFSYNTVVGERTIAAGYKEAAVYQDGQVVQGLGGGICQISTTLYNAALYANLEIVERRNHQFVPSYVGAGRDATVVYGSQDFKFKNNRNYAIKITCSVEGGVATFNIYGLAEPDDYDVTISSSVTSRGANSFTSATYKTLRKNGKVVSSTTISRDTYKVHH